MKQGRLFHRESIWYINRIHIWCAKYNYKLSSKMWYWLLETLPSWYHCHNPVWTVPNRYDWVSSKVTHIRSTTEISIQLITATIKESVISNLDHDHTTYAGKSVLRRCSFEWFTAREVIRSTEAAGLLGETFSRLVCCVCTLYARFL